MTKHEFTSGLLICTGLLVTISALECSPTSEQSTSTNASMWLGISCCIVGAISFTCAPSREVSYAQLDNSRSILNMLASIPMLALGILGDRQSFLTLSLQVGAAANFLTGIIAHCCSQQRNSVCPEPKFYPSVSIHFAHDASTYLTDIETTEPQPTPGVYDSKSEPSTPRIY